LPVPPSDVEPPALVPATAVVPALLEVPPELAPRRGPSSEDEQATSASDATQAPENQADDNLMYRQRTGPERRTLLQTCSFSLP
jgi:hypothetical protein